MLVYGYIMHKEHSLNDSKQTSKTSTNSVKNSLRCLENASLSLLTITKHIRNCFPKPEHASVTVRHACWEVLRSQRHRLCYFTADVLRFRAVE